MYLFWVYVLLAEGAVDLSLRWSLDGLLLSMLMFIAIMLLGNYRLGMLKEQETKKPDSNETNTKGTKSEKTEETEQEKLVREFRNRRL
jgi:membrane protein implicated in regulation of membrane protease activity